MICSIERLRAEIGNRVLFDIPAVEIEGRCCAIYGPSGIGKSTFLKALANGSASATVGSVTFHKLLHFNSAIAKIRYIPQHPPRFDFTIEKFLDRMLLINRDRIGCVRTLDDICDAFDLHPILKYPMADISGGQLHRVHLASALASKADLLLLDEPTAALDRDNVGILLQLLHEFVDQRDGYVICCTHDASFRRKGNSDDLWRAVEFPSFKTVEDV